MNQGTFNVYDNEYFYINFIGVDGSGKDTIFELVKKQFPNALLTREPGGTPEAEKIRSVILEIDPTIERRISTLKQLLSEGIINADTRNLLENAIQELGMNGLTTEAEVFLYAASRSEGIEKTIRPALNEGRIVLGRRSLACSVAYQGSARGYGMEAVWNINNEVVKGTFPSLEIFFDIPIDVAMNRLSNRTEKQDRLDLESYDFFEKAREGYLYYYKNICPYPYVIIDATKSIEEVRKQVENILHP